ncbi:MAG TPA: PAAR domain-containing protein [Thermoanaerobaculaceae bacterium]|nr:PAAR domain-containing protein [Thermoanaerobaculaceae bacterium]
MSLPAARMTDFHACPLVTVLVPHVGGPILPPGKPTVLIGNLPAATISAQAVCVGPIDVILPPGAPTVLIGGLPAARVTDMTAHGGTIMLGCFTVLIGSGGDSGGGGGADGAGGGSGGPGSCMQAARRSGSPLVAMR